MFGKKNQQDNAALSMNKAMNEAMHEAIQKAEKSDPLIRARLGAKEVTGILYDIMSARDSKGVHVPTLLGILGSVAGYSCMNYALLALKSGVGASDPHAIVHLKGSDGRDYLLGNLINSVLLENKYSVWSLVGGMVQELDSSRLPDVLEIVGHVCATIGGEEFGVPRLPEGQELPALPLTFVRDMAKVMMDQAQKYTTDAALFPILFGLAAQSVIVDAKDVLPAGYSAQIIMECAVPMSKITPLWLA